MRTGRNLDPFLLAGESTTLEFKASFDKATVESLVAFANAQGGIESEGLAELEKLNYIVNGHPTWAAMLLFAKEPIRHHIHIWRFKTPSMIIDDRQFTDTLFEVVDQSMKFVVSYMSDVHAVTMSKTGT